MNITCRCGSSRLSLTLIRIETAQFLNDAQPGVSPQFLPIGEPEVKHVALSICLDCGAVGPATGFVAAPSVTFPYFTLEEVKVCTPTILPLPVL